MLDLLTNLTNSWLYDSINVLSVVTCRTLTQSNSRHQEQLDVYFSFITQLCVTENPVFLIHCRRPTTRPLKELSRERESWMGVIAFTSVLSKTSFKWETFHLHSWQVMTVDSSKYSSKWHKRMSCTRREKARGEAQEEQNPWLNSTQYVSTSWTLIIKKYLDDCRHLTQFITTNPLGSIQLSTHDGVTVVFCCVERMNNEHRGDADFFKSRHRNGASPRCKPASNMFAPLFLSYLYVFTIIFVSHLSLNRGWIYHLIYYDQFLLYKGGGNRCVDKPGGQVMWERTKVSENPVEGRKQWQRRGQKTEM